MSETGDVCRHADALGVRPDIQMGCASVGIVRHVIGPIVGLCIFERPDRPDRQDGVEF